MQSVSRRIMIANETNVGFANRESVSIKASRPRLDQGYFQRAAYSEIDGAFGLSTAGNQSSFKLDRLSIYRGLARSVSLLMYQQF
jgi:hypothetical protein